jgi:hypothetical protein
MPAINGVSLGFSSPEENRIKAHLQIYISRVLEEAFELVDDGDLTEDEFRSFTFGNAARLHTSLNPDFFKGTVVESAVRERIE